MNDFFTNIDWFTFIYSSSFFLLILFDLRRIKIEIKELNDLHKYKRYFESLIKKIEISKSNVLRTSLNIWNRELINIINDFTKNYSNCFGFILNKDFHISTEELFNILDKESQNSIRSINCNALFIKDCDEYKIEICKIANKKCQCFIIEIERVKHLINGKRRDEFDVVCQKFIVDILMELIHSYEKRGIQ